MCLSGGIGGRERAVVIGRGRGKKMAKRGEYKANGRLGIFPGVSISPPYQNLVK